MPSADDEMIFDIGRSRPRNLADIISKAGTIVWNGPVGVFEFDQFGRLRQDSVHGDRKCGRVQLAGGGDIRSLRSRNTTSMTKQSYISTAGGAFLEYPRADPLPAVAMLEEAARK